jgi:glycerol-3-phosphate dehydrogenase
VSRFPVGSRSNQTSWWWELPYYWAGLKAYDALAIGRRLYSSYYLSSAEALRQFPMLSPEGLKGAVVYYDGQMNDARMNISLAVTAATKGATVVNHASVTAVTKDPDGKINGVQVRDNLTGDVYPVKARVVVNACGPFIDSICKMDNPNHQNLIVPAQGTHIMLPDFYSPDNMGLIVPKTKDGRVVFMLPWQGHTLAGTTDELVELTDRPHASAHEVNFILQSLTDQLQVEVRPADVLAVWAGIRPLAKDPTKTDTSSLVRNHLVFESDSGLVTIAGGKWTTYRRMAQDVVDHAVKAGQLTHAKPCQTENVCVIGGDGWDRAMFTKLIQNYTRVKQARGKQSTAPMNTDIALHLSESYGIQAFRVAELASQGYGKRLAHSHPYVEAEVLYAMRYEYAQTIADVVARRTRLSFIDSHAARLVVHRVGELMQAELGWSRGRRRQEEEDALHLIETMSIPPPE